MTTERETDVAPRGDSSSGVSTAATALHERLLDALEEPLLSVDRNGRVTYANGAAGRQWGANAHTLIGRSYRELVHVRDREDGVAAVLAGADPLAWLASIVRLDGTTRPLLLHATPLRASDGTIEAAIVRGRSELPHTSIEQELKERDAELAAQRTRLHKAERDAAVERARLRTLLHEVPAPVCVTRGAEHRYVMVNTAFAKWVGGAELLGRTGREITPQLAGHALIDAWDHVLASGSPRVLREARVRAPAAHDPSEIVEAHFTIACRPLRDADGAIEGVLTHATDMTDVVRARVHAEDHAAQLTTLSHHLVLAHQELEKFAYVLSHDLRGPVRGIGNLVQWIEDDLAGRIDPQTSHHVVLLRGRVRLLEELIDGILAYSRVGRARDDAETIDVRLVVEQVLDVLAPPREALIEILEPMPILSTERAPFAQVMHNLLANALTHGRGSEGVPVRVTAVERDSAWCFSVQDEGPGIERRFQERIWDMFQTLRPAGGRHGTGVGLALVRKIVEARGGRAWVESEPGRGATFHFTWPENPRIHAVANYLERALHGTKARR